MLIHDDEEYLNIAEIAEELDVNPDEVRELITTGKLKSREFDRVYYATTSDIKAFLENRKGHPGRHGR